MTSSMRPSGARLLYALAAAALLSHPGVAQEAERRWQFEVPSNAVPQTVSIGNHGTQVFSASDGHGARVRLFSSFDADPANSVWESDLGNDARNVRVASAELSTRHAVILMARPPSSSSYHAVVRAYDSNVPTHHWEWVSPNPSGLHEMSSVHVTADGSRVVAAFLMSSQQVTQVVEFNASTGAVLTNVQFPTFGGFYYSALSGNGRFVYLGYSYRSYVVDLQSAGTVNTVMTYVSTETGHAVTHDGSYFAASGSNLIRLFQRNGNGGYSASFDLNLDGATVNCRRIAISRDQSVLVAGFSLPNDRDVRIAAWNLATRTKILDRTLLGGGNYTNKVTGLAVSANGSKIAMGNWGDQLGQIPQVLLFEGGSSVPYAQFQLSGSAMGLALSQEGSWLAVARKSVHANIFAGGGSLELFATRPLEVRAVGQPRLGQQNPPLRIEVAAPSSGLVYVLSNTALETVPLSFDAGQLFVRRSGVRVTLLQTQPNGYHGTPWTLSTAAGNFVGQTLYFQGYSTAPRKLTQEYARVTVLP